MDSKMIERLFEVLDDMVRAEGTWKEKRDKIYANAEGDNSTNLSEFLSWFETLE